MPCLEPDKNLSKEAKQILLVLGNEGPFGRQNIAHKAGLAFPLAARKLRELLEKGLVLEDNRGFSLTEKGREAFSALSA